ncbi:hypothetical protein KKF84_14850, partial [Myxococcota bacterium]|nr:hypothetical protein [Myxococcota bacterium]
MDTDILLERKNSSTFSHFHDQGWLKHMGMTLLYTMTQAPQPIFGFATATGITILYKVLPEKYSGTSLITSATSASSSFLGTRVDTALRFSGTLLEFPNPKILTAFFLWKQNQNKSLMVQSLALDALISQGHSVQKAQETMHALGSAAAKLDLISEFLGEDPLPQWRTNGVAAYWVPREEGIRLTLHQELPAGPDFLTFMIDIFDQE